MTDTTPAGELRAAADELRTLATAATPGPWTQTGIGEHGWTVGSPTTFLVETDDSDQGRADADYIAALHPGVGHALADWLDVEANTWAGDEVHSRCTPQTCTSEAALAVARAVLGTEGAQR